MASLRGDIFCATILEAVEAGCANSILDSACLGRIPRPKEFTLWLWIYRPSWTSPSDSAHPESQGTRRAGRWQPAGPRKVSSGPRPGALLW